MIELTLLGLQTVRDSNGRELGSLAAQPKRFALLARFVQLHPLVVHRPRAVARTSETAGRPQSFTIRVLEITEETRTKIETALQFGERWDGL